ncbi:hypothetical protein FIBSPDRAFT_887748 [Athelia psychrophila]|uniref:Uncharacterized protein n=1 Tax=Athelia psychrophila TaxID=1759441 RepID=A0A166P6S6_9AGAM|nr:hypothetical protein FIBSPDRAFT_887748 [Fibularhizoctonia sp. CBS 109695]
MTCACTSQAWSNKSMDAEREIGGRNLQTRFPDYPHGPPLITYAAVCAERAQQCNQSVEPEPYTEHPENEKKHKDNVKSKRKEEKRQEAGNENFLYLGNQAIYRYWGLHGILIQLQESIYRHVTNIALARSYGLKKFSLINTTDFTKPVCPSMTCSQDGQAVLVLRSKRKGRDVHMRRTVRNDARKCTNKFDAILGKSVHCVVMVLCKIIMIQPVHPRKLHCNTSVAGWHRGLGGCAFLGMGTRAAGLKMTIPNRAGGLPWGWGWPQIENDDSHMRWISVECAWVLGRPGGWRLGTHQKS